MPKFLFFISLLTFFSANLQAQSQLKLGPNYQDDDRIYYQRILGKNNHFFFTSSRTKKSKIGRIYSLQTKELNEELVLDNSESRISVVSSLDQEFFYIIRDGKEEITISKRNSTNEEVAKSSVSKTISNQELKFYCLEEQNGIETLQFFHSGGGTKTYVYLEVNEEGISSELSPLIELKSEKSYLVERDETMFFYSSERIKDKNEVKYAEISDDLELEDEVNLTVDGSYYLDQFKNKYGDGLVLFSFKTSQKPGKGECFFHVNDVSAEIPIQVEGKKSLSRTEIFQFENHFLILGTYKEKNEMGFFSAKIDYSGNVSEINTTPIYPDYSTARKKKPNYTSFNLNDAFFDESSNSIVCVTEVVETTYSYDGSKASFDYISNVAALKIDQDGKLLWQTEIDVPNRTKWLNGNFYAWQDRHLILAHRGSENKNLVVDKVDSDGKIVETNSYDANEDFYYLKESRLFSDGLLLLKCGSSEKRKTAGKQPIRYTSVSLW